MRLWHKDLIKVLPRQQLLGQWRECCLIAKNISEQGTPNHILVNKILDYPKSHFWSYGTYVFNEMVGRGYKPDYQNFSQWFGLDHMSLKDVDDLFPKWHNEKYLIQCYCNLEEKHDCGGITDEEWNKVFNKVAEEVKE